jgi:hypothetical protein
MRSEAFGSRRQVEPEIEHNREGPEFSPVRINR